MIYVPQYGLFLRDLSPVVASLFISTCLVVLAIFLSAWRPQPDRYGAKARRAAAHLSHSLMGSCALLLLSGMMLVASAVPGKCGGDSSTGWTICLAAMVLAMIVAGQVMPQSEVIWDDEGITGPAFGYWAPILPRRHRLLWRDLTEAHVHQKARGYLEDCNGLRISWPTGYQGLQALQARLRKHRPSLAYLHPFAEVATMKPQMMPDGTAELAVTEVRPKRR